MTFRLCYGKISYPFGEQLPHVSPWEQLKGGGLGNLLTNLLTHPLIHLHTHPHAQGGGEIAQLVKALGW